MNVVAVGSAVGLAGFLCGMCVAPVFVTGCTLAGSLTAPQVRTEAFNWMTCSIGLGTAVGSILSGRFAGMGLAPYSLVLPVALLAAALLVSLGLRGRLVPLWQSESGRANKSHAARARAGQL